MAQKKSHGIVFLLATLCLLATLSGCAGVRTSRIERFQTKRDDRIVSKISTELDLTASQEELLEEVRSNIEQLVQTTTILSPEEKEYLRDAIASEELEIDSLLQIRKIHEADIARLHEEIFGEIKRFHAALSQGQRDKLADMLVERMK
ncbi:hypothetical protein [Sediminispirochaeta bajacaliforniensis]|uniref:hypothetical protein n=1 Tax=Sediminispirochaeta bajacaliforniensis TaxID=148 RepID=UPI0012B50EF6|nr:hypothetical protein [Sediminispirochaeta bajacaliforniensis]